MTAEAKPVVVTAAAQGMVMSGPTWEIRHVRHGEPEPAGFEIRRAIADTHHGAHVAALAVRRIDGAEPVLTEPAGFDELGQAFAAEGWP